MMSAAQHALRVSGLNKAYNAPVLTDFDFELQPGEVHALVGSNGAGKSTFAKILTGLTPRDSGTIELRGQPFEPYSKQEASAAGINMVLQELNVIPTLTVAENLFLSDLPTRGFALYRKKMDTLAAEALARLGLDELDPRQPASTLGVGQQQLVEIAGALRQKSSVLILDEPTATLTGPEIERLFENIDQLRRDGVALIYVSHRMDEIFRIADRVTVLRDGRRISTNDTKSTSERKLVRDMAGEDLAKRRPRSESNYPGLGLRVEKLRSDPIVRDVSFSVRKGEILGIAGLVGAGRTETLRAIFGADPIQAGTVHLNDDPQPIKVASPREALRAGIGMIPEDRKSDGLLLDKSVTLNTTLSTLPDHAPRGLIDFDSERTAVAGATRHLALKCDSLEQSMDELSGGNQQKVVIARWLLADCRTLLFDEPTRGIDVAAKETIYNVLDELASEGRALVVVSSDLLELMTISHRIVALSAGRTTGEFHPDTWSQEAITAACFSGYSKS